MNRSEILSDIKRELLGLGWKQYQTVDPPPHPSLKSEPQLEGDCPSTNSSLQISIFQIYQIFNISYFPQFNLSFEGSDVLSDVKTTFTCTNNKSKCHTQTPTHGMAST